MADQQAEVRAAKRQLRAQILARRAARDLPSRADLGAALAVAGMGRLELTAARCVCAYASVGGEPFTGPLLDGLRSAGVMVLLPVVAPDSALDWARYEGADTLAVGPFGLLQPAGRRLGAEAAARADVLLVPALAVDVSGWRLGQGGGYYDRLLARLAARTGAASPAWAVVHTDEILDAVPHDQHDVPVNAALTSHGFRPLPQR